MKHISSIIVILIAVILTQSSCKKWEKKDRTLYGKIIDSDTKAPITNTAFTLCTRSMDIRFVDDKQTYDEFIFTTDASGKFSATFNTANGYNLSIVYPEDAGHKNKSKRIWWQGSIGEKELEMNAGEVTAERR